MFPPVGYSCLLLLVFCCPFRPTTSLRPFSLLEMIYLQEQGTGFQMRDFLPTCYGEKNDDIVTLWEAPSRDGGHSDVLTLRNIGESWLILSRQSHAAS